MEFSDIIAIDSDRASPVVECMELSDMSVDGDRTLPTVAMGECVGLSNMIVDGHRALPPPPTVAVAVKGRGDRGGKGSRRTVRWAAENLIPNAGRLVLVHVMPKITSIPTPSGNTPIEQLHPRGVEIYRQIKSEEIFIPLKKLCKRIQVETLVLEDDNPASALLKYVADCGVSSLVLGSSSFIRILPNFMVRKLKDTVPSVVLKKVPEACNIYIVSKRRLITTSATPWSTCENSSINWWCGRGGSSSLRFYKLNSSHYSSSMDGEDTDTASSVSDLNHLDVLEILQWRYPHHFGPLPGRIYSKLRNSLQENEGGNECPSLPSTDTKQSNVYAEVEQLRGELMNAFGMYNQACVNLVHIEDEVRKLSSDCLNEARQVNAAMQNVEIYNKIADEEKTKHLEAVKEIEMARKQLAKEAHERHIAEMKAHEDSMEKKKIIEALFLNDRRYRRYTKDEIEIATDSFSETKIIGEGSYGKVYRCDLDKTPVAIKVLHSDALEKKEEFLTEIEVLSQLRHRHIVLLLGACPEAGCLVYEYMENGSLEDFISNKSSRHPLPWFVRFRIAFEVACGLAFLHNTKPDPIIHRDIKPGNIFLDRNYVSKIGDVGLAKIVPNVVPDNITEYRASVIAGTIHYMDPEYHRTGTVRPKSDLYAFGILVLQLLAAQPPNGLLLKFHNVFVKKKNGSLSDLLDKSIPDWPLVEAEKMAQMALKCLEFRCRDRPDLETEVLPLLKELADMANAALMARANNIHPPNHYFCPILEEVMEDPYIAADGYTYEHRAIKTWLERYPLSPVTRDRLQHTELVQNHTLRSAIQEWRSRIAPSSG